MSQLRAHYRNEEKINKKKTNQVLQRDIKEFRKKGRRRCQRQRRQSGHRRLHDDGEFIHDPVIFHNLKGYDLHLILQYASREYASNSTEVTPTTSEKSSSFQIGNLRFLDSLQFLTASLDTLVQSLAAMAEINLAIPHGVTRTLN